MKKAFTLAEALVSVAIIGVLAAILVPTVNNVRPDKDKVTYKKALYNVQSAVSTAMESSVYTMAANSAAYWGDSAVGESDFCESVAESLNTAGRVNCTGKSSYSEPNFITTDGIRYWGLEGKGFSMSDKKYTRDICVDRQMSSGEQKRIVNIRGDLTGPCAGGMKIQIRYDGKVSTPGDDNYGYESELIEDSFNMQSKH